MLHERLEGRCLFAAGTSFMSADAVVQDWRMPAIAPVEVGPQTFSLPASGRILLGFEGAPALASSVNPGKIQLKGNGAKPQKIASLANLGSANTSAAVFRVGPGSHTVAIRSERKTVGALVVTGYLVGDVNGDGSVDAVDGNAVDALVGTRSGASGYRPEADIDRNGRITRGDRKLLNLNLGAGLVVGDQNGAGHLVPGDLAIGGVDVLGFNETSGKIEFVLKKSAFLTDATEFKVVVNGDVIPTEAVTVAEARVTVDASVVDGLNEVAFEGVDANGDSLYLKSSFWTGSSALQVTLVDEQGLPFVGETVVTARLADNQEVSESATASGGFASFTSVPNRTILVSAVSGPAGAFFGSTGDIGSAGSVTVVMRGIGEVSTIDNNDLSLGTDGWTISSDSVSVLPHAAANHSATLAIALADEQDNDLHVGTAGEGEQSATRTFQTSVGATAVLARYRFVTSEVPGGYFGSQFNDYFRVSLRAQKGGESAAESNSMNGLGMAVFDAGGATDWREVRLPVNPKGDIVRFDAVVANVADGLYDSSVVIDYIAEEKSEIRPNLAWNDMQGGASLSYELSGDELTEDRTIDVYWSNGTGYAGRVGSPVFSYKVAAGTFAGSYGPIQISGSVLQDPPAGATHLLAVASEESVHALADVRINFAPTATEEVVAGSSLKVLANLLRKVGASSVLVTSTARSAAGQARAMFQNLTRAGNTIEQNIAIQREIYTAPGNAVIDVFENAAAGKAREQVVADAIAIRAAMEAEIISQGPSSVSKHCADPATLTVLDILQSSFSGSSGGRFYTEANAAGHKTLSENSVYHIEIVP